MKKIRITLHGEAVKKFYWLKEEMGLEEQEAIEEIFALAMNVMKKTQGDKEITLNRRKLKDGGVR